MDAGSIWVTIGANVDGLVKGIDLSKKSLTDWRDTTNANTKDMVAWGAAVTAQTAPFLALGYAVHSEVDKFGSMAQNLKDLANQTGITTDKLQDLKYAALLSGTSFDKVSLALNVMTVAMGDAADTTGPAYAAFMGLGVDPNGRTPDEVFDDLAVALSKIEDPAQRASAAQNIFGKSYKDMLPYMQEYVDKQDEIARHATFSEEDLQSMEDAKVGWDKLSDSLTIFEGKLFGVLGAAQKVIDAINPIKQYLEGSFNVGDYGDMVATTVYGDTYTNLKTATATPPAVTVNINNPSGTAAQEVAIIQQMQNQMAWWISMGGP